MTDIDIQVLMYDSASQIDNYSLDPREDPENLGQYFGIFTWNQSSFYPTTGLNDPGLQLQYDHEAVDVIESKYFKSGIGDSDALELVSQDKSIAPGSIDLTLNHGSVYINKVNIPVPSVTSVGVAVQGLSLSTVDATPVTLTKIGVPVRIEGEEHFIAEIVSPGFIPTISRKWRHVNKFTGNCVSGKTLETYHAPLQYKNIDQTEYEYLIYGLPERSTVEEYGYKCQLQLPTLTAGVNNVLTNFLVDPIGGKVISQALTVAGTETLSPTINRVIYNPFTRTDIFNVQLNVGTPSAAGEYKINYTTGTLEVYIDLASGDINFPGLVDFYTDYPTYVILNQNVNNTVGPTTYANLSGLFVTTVNVILGEKLTTSGQASGDTYTYALQNGGITDFRLFRWDGAALTPTELTEYTGEDAVPVDEFKVNRFQGTVSFTVGGLASYDVYAMYNYGPVGHLESILHTTVEYKDIQLVADLSSNNNGYIVLAQAPKSIASITYELLSTTPIDDIDTNSYLVDIDSIFNMKVCVKSPTGKPVPGVPISFTSVDGDIEVLFTTGNTDRNGCVFMTFKAPGVEEMLIPIPWYKFTPQADQAPAAWASGASIITVNSSVVPNSLIDPLDPNYDAGDNLITAPLKFVLEVSDVLNPLGGGYPVVLQYKVISSAAGPVAGTLNLTIDGTLPFKSSGYTTASNLIGMYSKAQLFRNRYATALTSSQQLVDSTTTPGVVRLTDPRIKADFADLVNGVFIYKTLANETLSPASITRIGNSDVLANGTSLIIEDDTAATQAITAYANDAGEPQLTVPTHGYADDQVVIVAGTNTTVTVAAAAEAATYSNSDKTVTFQLEQDIVPGTLTFTFDTLSWMDTGDGSVIQPTPNSGYTVGTVNYATGVVVLNKSTAITLALSATVTYDYTATYNGAWKVKSAALNTFVLENAVYKAGVTTLGTVIATSDKFITLLDPTNSTFVDGYVNIDNAPAILDSTDIGDTALFGNLASFNNLSPFQYVLLPTGKTSQGYFTATDPFSGKIIQSDTWSITMGLPTNSYGALVLNNNLISSGSYIL